MKIPPPLLLALVAFALMEGAGAQMNPSAAASGAVRIAEARRANAALMQQYTWDSRTDIIEDGQTKDIRLDLVNYGPTGQLQRTVVNDQESSGHYLPTPIGFLRKGVAAEKKKRLEEYLTGLRGLLEQYTLPTTGKILDFMSTAQITGPDSNGWFRLSGNNVVVPGDNMTLSVDAITQQVRRVVASTSFKDDAVQLDATFRTLASGLNYAALSEATVPAKNLTVQVQNYNYSRPN